MKAPLRTKSIGTKVSEEEFAALEATARAADMTLSEWVRAVLLAAPGVELPGDEAALAGRVALAELLALRTLLLNLFFRAAKGQVARSTRRRELCPVHRSFIAMSGSSGKAGGRLCAQRQPAVGFGLGHRRVELLLRQSQPAGELFRLRRLLRRAANRLRV
jgi:hypothetical protein